MSATVADVLEGRERWCVVEGRAEGVLSSLAVGSVDHVIADPPYDEHTHAVGLIHERFRPGGAKNGEDRLGFAPLEDPAALAECLLRVVRRWVLAFCALEMLGDYKRGAGAAWIRSGVWDKVNPSPQLSADRPAQGAEAIAIMHVGGGGPMRWNGGGSAAIWRHAPPRGNERPDHPTPKPVPLMLELIEQFTDPGDLVLDPYCGSGTTGLACVLLGRRFIGVDINPAFVAMAHLRIRGWGAQSSRDARSGQLPLLEGT